MLKNSLVTIVFLFFFVANAQNVDLPGDIRQHNLTNLNTSLLNPAYSLNAETSQSLGIWARWQWQTIDSDPTSIFLNYNRKIGEASSIGVGFLQNNTGVYSNTGGFVNYGHTFELSSDIILGVGVNVMGYSQELSDTRFQIDPQIQLPQFTSSSNSFVMQVAPGINLQMDKFSFGFVAENLFDYNFTNKERSSVSGDRVFLGLASYEFPISLFNFDENAFIRPSVYYKSVPNQDSQIGITTLLNTNKFWAQAGYNDFYGVSAGIGGNFFKHLSFGVLMEFGSSSDLKGVDPTFELVSTYNFGKKKPKKNSIKEDADKIKNQEQKKEAKLEQELTRSEALATRNDEKEKSKQEKLRLKQEKDSLFNIKKRDADLAINVKENRKRAKDSIKAAKRRQKIESNTKIVKTEVLSEEVLQKRKLDSIDRVKLEEALAFSRRLREKRKNDSLGSTKSEVVVNTIEESNSINKEVVIVQAGEKYEEVAKEGGLEPGYYLIANIFGTKKYFELFMKDMKKKGLTPGSFYRAKNRFNYVYLGKYNTIKEARAARDSKLNGKYTSKTWIFRVAGE